MIERAFLPPAVVIPLAVLLIWVVNTNAEKQKEVIRIGYITGSQKPLPGMQQKMYYRKPGQAISGAITLAVNEINADPSILPDHELRFIIAETYGEELYSVRETALLASSRNVSVIIGPQETCQYEARMAAAFNLPMISYVSTIKCQDDLIHTCG